MSLVGISLAVFLTGILLLFLFAVTLGVLPSFGRGEVVRLGFWTTGLLTAERAANSRELRNRDASASMEAHS